MVYHNGNNVTFFLNEKTLCKWNEWIVSNASIIYYNSSQRPLELHTQLTVNVRETKEPTLEKKVFKIDYGFRVSTMKTGPWGIRPAKASRCVHLIKPAREMISIV